MKRFEITNDTPLNKVKEQLDLAIEGHHIAKIGLMLALLTRENIYTEGLQGTAKTLLAVVGAKSMELDYFFFQAHRDMRFPELTEGDVLVETRLPNTNPVTSEETKILESRPNNKGILRAEIAVIDDITRTPGEALNVLLQILNEHTFQDRDLPLITAIATSNPTVLSEEGGTYNPTYYNEPLDPANLDRFLIHIKMDSYLEKQKFIKGKAILSKAAENYQDNFVPQKCMERKKLKDLQSQLLTIPVPESVIDLLLKVYGQIFHPTRLQGMRNVVLSDRTFFKKMIKLMKASALLAGRNECTSDDIYVLRFVTAFRVPAIHPHIEEIIDAILAGSLKDEKAVSEKAPEQKTHREENAPDTSNEVDPFQAPKKRDASEQEEKKSEATGNKEEIPQLEDSEIEQEAPELEETFFAHNPASEKPGPEENTIPIKGKPMTERIEGIEEFFMDMKTGDRRSAGENHATRTGGIPRDWETLKEFSDINKVPAIDLISEKGRKLRIPKRKEKRGHAIALLRDISSSMSEKGAEIAARVHNGILDFAEHHRIPLLYLSFHSEPYLYTDNGLVFTQYYKPLRDEATKTDVRSATNYQKALREFLLATSRYQYIKNIHLIVVGDGRTNIGDFFAEEEIKELQSRRIKTYTINTETETYYNTGEYPPLFRRLVKWTNGNAYEVIKNKAWHLLKKQL